LRSTSSAKTPHPRKAAASSRRRRPSAAVPKELREAGFSTRKALGQHFLTDARILRRIADACELTTAGTVVEVGAGTGALTAELSRRAGRVVAVELDDQLCAYLRQRFAGTNVTVVCGDVRALPPAELLAQAGVEPPYTVAGNLPYYVAQPVLRHFLEGEPQPERLLVMVQAEVAESIVARPPKMSLLGVSVQLYGEAVLLFRVPPSAFAPPPKVQSAVVRIDVAPRPRAGARDSDAFFTVVRAGFSAPRKQLRNSLARGLGIEPALAGELLAAAVIDPTLRPQALALEQWSALTDAWLAAGRPEATS
jgi:16S rRNA (adenine1518-N6/adenine1519-N6)-dimethyltransferase